jgi:predicted phage terminase large subunit-like protein
MTKAEYKVFLQKQKDALDELEKLAREEAEKLAIMMPLKAKEDYATYVQLTHQFDKEFKIALFQIYVCNCIDKLLKNELLNEKGEPYIGIALSQPPQTGKSRCVTETLPSYFLGKNPFKNVIEVSYSDTFANKFGRRNLEKINQYGKRLFNIDISKAKAAAEEFEIEGTRGGMLSAGLNGQITGNPADLCFPAGTMIATENGEIEISALLAMVNMPRILSYDHTCDKIVLKNIVARRTRYEKEFTVVKTANRKEIKSTRDHRYYTESKGYTQAQLLRRDDILYSLDKKDMPTVRKAEGQKKQDMPSMLQPNKRIGNKGILSSLRESYRNAYLRVRKGIEEWAKKLLLQPSMYVNSIQARIFSKMPCMRKPCKKRQEILFKKVCKFTENIFKPKDKLPCLCEGISTKEFKDSILQQEVCRQGTFGKNEREGQFTLQGRNKLCKTIQRNATLDIGERREQVRLLQNTVENRGWRRQNEYENSSYKRGCQEQHAGEFNNDVCDLPCKTPQIRRDAVYGIENVSRESIEVYDIQVEETHNFFANGILVHNCIVDDPYKTMAEADSPSHQALVMDVWTSAIKMRVSAICKFLVVHTRWNEDDLIGYLLATEPDRWYVINLPMIAEEDEPHTGRKIGDPLLPEAGKGKEWVEEQKESFLNDPLGGGLRTWNAGYQQRPSSKEGNLIKREYWQRYKLTLKMQKGEGFDEMLQSWDCSFKDTKNSDLVAGGAWGRMGANCFLLDVDYRRMDIVATMKAITAMAHKWPKALCKLIEDKANGSAVITMMKTKLPGMVPIQATKSKEERVNAVLPVWESQNIFIPDEIEVREGVFVKCKWADEVIDQCANFKPGKKVQKDDLVDMCSQAINRLMYAFNFGKKDAPPEGFHTDDELQDMGYKPYEIKQIKKKMKKSWEK